MSTKNDKWSMFKNYMHNELGITKEDIREWIEEAVKIEVKKVVNDTFKSFDIEKQIEKTILNHYNWNTSLKSNLERSAAEHIAKNYVLKLKE